MLTRPEILIVAHREHHVDVVQDGNVTFVYYDSVFERHSEPQIYFIPPEVNSTPPTVKVKTR